jgi:hypothetical protein
MTNRFVAATSYVLISLLYVKKLSNDLHEVKRQLVAALLLYDQKIRCRNQLVLAKYFVCEKALLSNWKGKQLCNCMYYTQVTYPRNLPIRPR